LAVGKSTLGNVGSVEKCRKVDNRQRRKCRKTLAVEKSTVGNVGSRKVDCRQRRKCRKRPRAMSKSSVDSRERRK
jgi:hypothetical protein